MGQAKPVIGTGARLRQLRERCLQPETATVKQARSAPRHAEADDVGSWPTAQIHDPGRQFLHSANLDLAPSLGLALGAQVPHRWSQSDANPEAVRGF